MEKCFLSPWFPLRRLLLLAGATLLTPVSGAVEVTLAPPHPVSAPGLTESVVVALEEAGAPVASTQAALSVTWPDGSTLSLKQETEAGGTARYEIAVPRVMPTGHAELKLEAASFQQKVVAQMDVLEKARYDELDALAASIPLAGPLRVLYLGDSLTAQQEGSNHVDKVRFWLEKQHPGKTTFRNAAVGGDSIRTVWRRFEHVLDPAKKAQFRQERYDDIFGFKPDVIFIFLGHNDNKATSKSDFKEPSIPFEVQDQCFHSVIDLLKEKNPEAKVVLISSVSPVEEIARARSEKRLAEGHATNRHGVPALMERYNEQLQRIAGEYGFDYVDVYTPTKNHPDKASLFNPKDGVHLTVEGNRFIATQVLQYLAGPNRVLAKP
ncbi:MAG TPA: SGNH/GDSL hydrolase family protein [Chthoniobacteraceae bacterium]|nr:SGNH/GDSL hydrolase family protein [Chthoniobacteraceae bacterium]